MAPGGLSGGSCGELIFFLHPVGGVRSVWDKDCGWDQMKGSAPPI